MISPSSKTREAQMKQRAFQCCSISAALRLLLTLPVDALGRTRDCPAAGRRKHNLTLPLKLTLTPHTPTHTSLTPRTATHSHPTLLSSPPSHLTTYTLLLTLTPKSLPHTPTPTHLVHSTEHIPQLAQWVGGCV